MTENHIGQITKLNDEKEDKYNLLSTYHLNLR